MRIIAILSLILTTFLKVDAKVYALIIGVNDYTWQSDLRYASKDALLFRATLEHVNPTMDVEYNVLIDEDASVENIVENFGRYISIVNPKDTFIFYFSGHGSDKGIYVSDGYSKSGMYTYDLLKLSIRYIAADTKLIFMDACQSASIVQKSIDQYKDDPFYKKAKKTKSNGQSQNTMLFLGSGARESATETKLVEGGLFTFFLCYGLSGEADFNKDNLVQIDELFYFFRNNTFAASRVVSPNYQCPLLVGNFDKKLIIADLNRKL